MLAGGKPDRQRKLAPKAIHVQAANCVRPNVQHFGSGNTGLLCMQAILRTWSQSNIATTLRNMKHKLPFSREAQRPDGSGPASSYVGRQQVCYSHVVNCMLWCRMARVDWTHSAWQQPLQIICKVLHASTAGNVCLPVCLSIYLSVAVIAGSWA